MKKLDKFIFQAFLGPFFLTFAVVEFILLTQYMLKYFDDFVGKDLGAAVFAELIFYFSLNMAPAALPLAVLLSSLMTFGNLGEHHELTAIKTSGISLVRILRPIFFFVILVTGVAFLFNNYIVPKANLKAYSLLWDIRQKKPSLDLKEGSFYNGLPGYSLKVNKKFSDGKTLKDIMIYDHTSGRGNTNVTLADSGKMYSAYNDRYLVLELFDGINYNEQQQQGGSTQGFVRSRFKASKFVFSLESFKLDRTKEELFADNKMMMRLDQLKVVVDSLRKQVREDKQYLARYVSPYYSYFKPDTVLPAATGRRTTALPAPAVQAALQPGLGATKLAAEKARGLRSFTNSYAERQMITNRDANGYENEMHRKFTQSIACLIMFLIGAPLGAIIRKGGLGVPVLISIFFFITFYIFTILGEKWSREGLIQVWSGMWLANGILLPIGLFFLNQARHDSNLLDATFWRSLLSRFRRR